MESKANVRRGAKDLQLFERKRIEQMPERPGTARKRSPSRSACVTSRSIAS